jgi:cytidylate kinase
MAARGENLSLEDVLKAQEDRDRRDSRRDLAPMVPAPDAILLDSTHLSLSEVVARMEQEVVQRKKKGN